MRLRLRLNSINTFQKTFFHASAINLNKYFITTPIYYLNSVPHIGHYYTCLLADVVKRWYELQGTPTIFSTGTDEHGLKVLKAATLQEQNVLEYCHDLSASFRNLFDIGNISYTSFIRTTDQRHVDTVRHAWVRNVPYLHHQAKELKSRGLIKRGSYRGWYSIADESYVPQDQVKEVENSNGRPHMVCSVTGNRVEWSEEENFMFPLSRFSDRLLAWLESGVIHPSNHMEPIKKWVNSGLPNLSLSRQVDKNPWGIPVPGNSDQNVYVWLDALVNYLTVSYHYNTSSSPPSPTSSSSSSSSSSWPPDCQVVGKDIIKFHAVYWPCFLMALDLPLPRKIICHGHWMVEKQKMSKSIGNVVDPVERVEAWSSDALRYYLMKESSISSDCDYSDSRAIDCINADLVNTYGNLLNRSTGKSLNPSQQFPPYNSSAKDLNSANNIFKDLYNLADRVNGHYKSLYHNKALELIMGCLYDANAYFQSAEPWKKERQDIDTVLHVSMEVIRVCSIALLPVIPTIASKALDRLNIPQHARTFEHMKMHVDQIRGGDYRLGPDTGVLLRKIKKD